MNVHSNVRKHACEICNKRFTRADHMINHVKVAHVGVKPYKCIAPCGQRFDTYKEKLLHRQSGQCAEEQFRIKSELKLNVGEGSSVAILPVTNIVIKTEYEDPLKSDEEY